MILEFCLENKEDLKMKELYKLVTIFFVGMMTFASCANENELIEVEKEIENVTFKLGFERQADKEVINSRATENENKLYDLHFYVFNAKGDLTGYTKLESTDGSIDSPGPKNVTIKAMTGESYIYAVANINKSTTYYLEEADKQLLNVIDVSSSTLKKDDLLAVEFKRQYGTEGSELFSPNPAGNIFVMSGYLNDGKSVTIQKDASGNAYIAEGIDIVKLYRILAKNTLSITSNVANGTFTPKYYRLCNVPKGGLLIPHANISNVEVYTEDNVTDADVESSYRWNFGGDTEISFYYPENLQVSKSNDIDTWKERESNTWNNDVKTFTVADDKAAYIEIYGDYEANSGEITANVSYSIHFGDFSPSGSIDDFNVVRNHAYIYDVTVVGIDDIKVEAEREGNNPYAEGLIIDATAGTHYEVDAHYEARVMTFDVSTIRALKNNGSGYILNIKTPFGETKETVNVKNDGVYRMGAVERMYDLNNVASLFTNEADYQWIKFVKNTEDNVIRTGADISKNVCKYPGDSSAECLNVFQLLAQLYDEDTYTESNGTKVYYTCFIDENYYAQKSWTAYVDKDPRNMLIANELNVSQDGKSLYAKVAYSISQRSISTFYTTNYVHKKAFGTEIIDEEEIYDSRFNNNRIGQINNPNDWNARTSAVSTNTSKTDDANKWYNNIVTKESSQGIQPLYSTAAKACMSRNRDLDGNGTIEDGEVRWYLAAVDQYRALFFGQNALDQDAYLISRDELEDIDNANWGNSDQYGHSYRSKYHYYTSSEKDKATFWPEEGLTNNPANPQGWVSEAQLVRCIRTLESGAEGLDDPERFYTYANNTFNLDGIVATRNYTEEPLEMHNEIQDANNLYSSFVVAKKDLQKSRDNYNFSLSDITGSKDPCVNYKDEAGSWRTPNQKEFALMNSNIRELAYDDRGNKLKYGTRTKFSGSDLAGGYWNWHNTPGFWSEGERINVGTGHESGVRIRCVKDKK